MTGDDRSQRTIRVGQRISADLAEYAAPTQLVPATTAADELSQLTTDELLAEYDRRITCPELRAATRTRFTSEHYADAVEAGVKALNECIRRRTGRTEDGDGLMTLVFSAQSPLLRINSMRSRSELTAQRGHMLLCQGVVAAWRNPRAHALTDDQPARCLMMLETIGDLIETTKAAVRTRRHATRP